MTNAIEIPQGARLIIPITWNNSDGTPVDITGYSAEFTIREPKGAEDLLKLTNASGIVLGNSDGTFTITIPASFSETRAGFHGVAVLDAIASVGADPDRVARVDCLVTSKY